MTDDEKREIYCVADFPKSDLGHMMAGVPLDKDFSNAKPTNQVSANTFATHIEPYVRPLTEEDIAFLKEKVSENMVLGFPKKRLMFSTRVIGQPLSSSHVVERNIIQKYGVRRTGQSTSNLEIRNANDSLSTRVVATLNKLPMKRQKPIMSLSDLWFRVFILCCVSNIGLSRTKTLRHPRLTTKNQL
jgi:hypothetical protein